MTIIKVGEGRYINVDRITHVEPGNKGKLTVHFAVGAGDYGGPRCCMKMEGNEAQCFTKWLDAQSRKSET